MLNFILKNVKSILFAAGRVTSKFWKENINFIEMYISFTVWPQWSRTMMTSDTLAYQEYLSRPLTIALIIGHKVHRAPCTTSIVLTTPWDNGVRTLLPPTRTSQLNVYEASGVDRAFGHKYELSAVNAPSRADGDRKETESRLRFYSKTSTTISHRRQILALNNAKPTNSE